jgi:hypothetical protein
MNEILVCPYQFLKLAGMKGKVMFYDFCNIRAAQKRMNRLDVRTPIQYLLERLLSKNCISRHIKNITENCKKCFDKGRNMYSHL